MARNKRKSHPHNFSARVDEIQMARLDSIRLIYGDGANPSAIASTLLRTAADVGPERYHEFMKRVAQTAAELRNTG
jgi:hypothetical protein